jgi:hypothetical protein
VIERPTTWPDGRPLGGENGYPPEWHEWARECEVKYVAKQMLRVPQASRKATHAQWEKKFPHATPQRIKSVWDEVVAEERATRQGHKTQQLRNNATKTQQMRNADGHKQGAV